MYVNIQTLGADPVITRADSLSSNYLSCKHNFECLAKMIQMTQHCNTLHLSYLCRESWFSVMRRYVRTISRFLLSLKSWICSST